MSDRATAIKPVGGSGFNELDNWLEIMDADPPNTMPEKHVMYERLLDILADTLETENEIPEYAPPNKRRLRKEFQSIIER